MKIEEAIAWVDEIKPNAFSSKVKLVWLNALEGRIAADVFLMAPAEISALHYTEKDMGAELLVAPPHDDIYTLWLQAKIDAANGEYNKYANSMAIYNEHYGNFLRWFADLYDPAQSCRIGDLWENYPYYITAYGLAVKRGFTGNMDEWLKSLKGDQGDPMTVLGHYGTLEDLKAAVTEPEQGNGYAVGAGEPYRYYIYDEVLGWVDHGTLSPVAAESWARGGTNTRQGEDTDNAMYYAAQAEDAMEAAAASREAAESSADAASQSATSAGESASAAADREEGAAASASDAANSQAEAQKAEQSARSSASSADTSASEASRSADSAAGSASTAEQKASEAASSASEAAAAADNAKTSETNAKSSETASGNYRKDAQAAKQAIENMTVSVKTLAPGSAATATKTTEGGVVNIEYGIPRGEQGQGLTIYGYYSTVGELEEAVPSPQEGAAYGIGVTEPYDIYIWDSVHGTWKNNGPIQGPAGPQGEQGPPGPAGTDGHDGAEGPAGPAGADGKSAYQIATEGGWTGTEADFNAALANVGDIGAVLDAINGEVI